MCFWRRWFTSSYSARNHRQPSVAGLWLHHHHHHHGCYGKNEGSLYLFLLGHNKQCLAVSLRLSQRHCSEAAKNKHLGVKDRFQRMQRCFLAPFARISVPPRQRSFLLLLCIILDGIVLYLSNTAVLYRLAPCVSFFNPLELTGVSVCLLQFQRRSSSSSSSSTASTAYATVLSISVWLCCIRRCSRGDRHPSLAAFLLREEGMMPRRPGPVTHRTPLHEASRNGDLAKLSGSCWMLRERIRKSKTAEMERRYMMRVTVVTWKLSEN